MVTPGVLSKLESGLEPAAAPLGGGLLTAPNPVLKIETLSPGTAGRAPAVPPVTAASTKPPINTAP